MCCVVLCSQNGVLTETLCQEVLTFLVAELKPLEALLRPARLESARQASSNERMELQNQNELLTS